MPAYVSDVLLDPVKRAEHFEKHVAIDPVTCVCHKTWVPSVKDLESQKCVCPFCGHNPHKMSPDYYRVLYPITLNKSALLYRSDNSWHLIDVTCRTCHKAIRVVIKSAIQRLKEGLPICWICDSRKGGRTGELFMYNYPELVDRIKGEVPKDDFYLAVMTYMQFEYDCGHIQSMTPKRFMKNHKRCDECTIKYRESRRAEKEAEERARPRRRRSRTREEIESGSVVYKRRVHCSTYKSLRRATPKRVDAKCCKCDTVFNIQIINFKKNLKRNKGQYICGICASSKGIRLADKLKVPEFAHVFWSNKNEFSPDDITASSGRRVILECEKGHEWSPFAYAIGGCPQCMQGSMTSKEEDLFAGFLSSLLPNTEICRSVRGLIYPQEVDIYIPSKQVAIEFNGLYWHSEKAGKGKDYHYNKWLSCKNKGVRLITVWEDDWRYRRDAVTQYITDALSDTYSTNLDKDISLFLESNVIDDSMLSFLDKYSLYDQQYIINESSSFIIGQDSSGLISSISAVSSFKDFSVIGSHVCRPGFGWNSLTGVFRYLQNTVRYNFGFLDSKDNPVLHDDLLEILGLNSSIDILPARRNCKYENNSSFRIKCDKDYDRWIWNSGYTLWYA